MFNFRGEKRCYLSPAVSQSGIPSRIRIHSFGYITASNAVASICDTGVTPSSPSITLSYSYLVSLVLHYMHCPTYTVPLQPPTFSSLLLFPPHTYPTYTVPPHSPTSLLFSFPTLAHQAVHQE